MTHLKQIRICNVLYVNGFGINSLIAGLIKIDFFSQKRHLLSSSIDYAKYEHFT